MNKGIQSQKLRPKRVEVRHSAGEDKKLASSPDSRHVPDSDSPNVFVCQPLVLSPGEAAVSGPLPPKSKPDDKGMSTKTKATSDPNSNQQELSDPLCVEKKSRATAQAAVFSQKNLLNRIGVQRKNWMLFQTLNCSTKDCFLCTKKMSLRQVIRENLNKKYLTSRESYDAKVVNDIIYNENTHIVVLFKDYLIYDDVSEFLKRSYTRRESAQRLPKIFDFYNKYSKVFPNYVILEERRFMFKNIERKQRVIDEQQKCAADMRKKKNAFALTDSDIDDKIFTTRFVGELDKPDSILGRTLREAETQMQAYRKNQGGARKAERTVLEEMSIRQLVEKFIMKDSMSMLGLGAGANIDVTATMKQVPEKKKPTPQRHARAASTLGIDIHSRRGPAELKAYATSHPQVRDSPSKRVPRSPPLPPEKARVQSRNGTQRRGASLQPGRTAAAGMERRQQPLASQRTVQHAGTQRQKPAAETKRSKSQGKPEHTPAKRNVPAQRDFKRSQTADRILRPQSQQKTRECESSGKGHKRTANTPQPAQARTAVDSMSRSHKATPQTSVGHSRKNSNPLIATLADRRELLDKKKVLAIDIEALNKNLQKQRLAFDSRMLLKSAKAKRSAKIVTTECGSSSRTPDSNHKRFKSEYLNSLRKKVEGKAESERKPRAGKEIGGLAIERATIGSILGCSKSIASLLKARTAIGSRGRETHRPAPRDLVPHDAI